LWHVYEAPEGRTLASWMKPEDIASIRRLLPPSEAARLYDNIWVEETEDLGYLSRQQVVECELVGRTFGLSYRDKGEKGVNYFAAVDYGPKKDRTVMCVVHLDRKSGIFMVDKMDVLQGSHSEPVQITKVEEWLHETNRNFNQPPIIIDPYQMESTLQKYKDKLFLEKFEFRGGKGNYKMAELMRSLIVNKTIGWYAGCGGIYANNMFHTLTDEISELMIRRMNYGYRIDHDSGKHDDRAVALGMALMLANKNQMADFTSPLDENEKIITLKDSIPAVKLPNIAGVGGHIKPFGVG
jgi:hypothetical protein